MKSKSLLVVIIAACMVGAYTSMTNLFSHAMTGTGEFSNEGHQKEGRYYVWERDMTESLEGIEWGMFETVNGTIAITSHEDPDINEAKVHAVIKIKPGWLSGESAVLNAKRFYDVKVEKHEDKIIVTGVHPKHKPRGISHASIALDVVIPKRLNAEVHSVNGKIKADRIDGEMVLTNANGRIETTQCMRVKKAKTVNGAIDLHDLVSLRHVEAVNGSIAARFAESPKQSCEANTVNGSLKFYFPRDAKYNMRVNTTNGSINYPQDRFDGLHKKGEVNGKINGGGAEVIAGTVNGSVSFRDV